MCVCVYTCSGSIASRPQQKRRFFVCSTVFVAVIGSGGVEQVVFLIVMRSGSDGATVWREGRRKLDYDDEGFLDGRQIHASSSHFSHPLVIALLA